MHTQKCKMCTSYKSRSGLISVSAYLRRQYHHAVTLCMYVSDSMQQWMYNSVHGLYVIDNHWTPQSEYQTIST